MLRPLDLIHPHRLEMGTRLNTARGKNLYAFWGDTITEGAEPTAASRAPRWSIWRPRNISNRSSRSAELPVITPAVRGLEERQVQNHLVLRQARTRPDGALRGRQGITDPQKLKKFDGRLQPCRKPRR
jgi:hypothetical protein